MRSYRRLLTRRQTAAQDDRGIAMIAAISAIAIIAAFGAVVGTLSVRNVDDSATERSRVQTIDAAEAGLDVTYARMEAGKAGCPDPAAKTTLTDTSPTKASYQVSIRYQDADGNQVSCDAGELGGVPATAVITSRGQTGTSYGGASSHRTMQASVQLEPIKGYGWKHAIYSDSGITTTNDLQLLSNGVDGGLYTNGDFGCNSNGDFHGAVVTQGKAKLENNCHVHGDLWAKDEVTMNNKTQVDGSVFSKTGGADFPVHSPKIGGDLIVAGDLTYGDGKQPWVGGRIIHGATSVPAQDPQTLPRIDPDAGSGSDSHPDWNDLKDVTGLQEDFQTESWQQFDGNCTAAHWHDNNRMVSPKDPTIVDARDCSTLTFNGSDVDLKLRSDLVIFAKNFYSTNGLSVESDDGQPHRLWIIVPWTNGSDSCHDSDASQQGRGIKFDAGGTDLDDPNVSLFLYSPGNIYLTNHTSFTGQVYGCKVREDSNVHITYKAIGVPGVPTSDSAGYSVRVQHTREVPNSDFDS